MMSRKIWKNRKSGFKKRYYRKLFATIKGEPIACCYCGQIVEKNHEGCREFDNMLTLDHIRPLSKHGDVVNIDNIAIACKKCNTTKGNKSFNIKELEKQFTNQPIVAILKFT